MDDLEADIARVAALRRMKPADVNAIVTRQAEQRRKAVTVQKDRVLGALFGPYPYPRDDILTFDSLPARSRDVLRQLDTDISARRWADALQAFDGDEAALIEAVFREASLASGGAAC